MIGFDEHGIGKGSARSVPGVDLGRAVIAARQDGLLQKGGGHPMAAGITIAADRLAEFSRRLHELIPARPGAVHARRPLDVDASVTVGACRHELAASFQQLQPFGAGNDEPRLHLVDVKIADARSVGAGHVAVRLEGRDGAKLNGIAFRALERPLGDLLRTSQRPVHLAGTLKLDRYQGTERVNFQIEDAST